MHEQDEKKLIYELFGNGSAPYYAAYDLKDRLRDPWVKVGTTTIDGTFEQVRDAFGSTWENVDHMLYALASGDVFDFDGRSLMVHSREVDDAGVMVCCDIVRRQSEIDAEKVSRDCAIFDGLMRVHMANHPCPECGPHGNVGRVLLLESWVDCGTCKPTASAVTTRKVSPVLTVGDLALDDEVEVQRARDQGAAAARAARGLRGAREVAALRSSLTEATVDNLRRYEALMADFKAAITIPSMPPGGYPTHDEYANYLSEHLSANLGAVDYDDASISRAARMIDDLSGGQWLLVASQALVP